MRKLTLCRFEVKWADSWVGLFWRREAGALDVWICFVPWFPLHLRFGERRHALVICNDTPRSFLVETTLRRETGLAIMIPTMPFTAHHIYIDRLDQEAPGGGTKP